MTGPEGHQVGLVSIPGGVNIFDPNQNEGKPRRLIRFDTGSGRTLGRTEISGLSDPVALEPGRHARADARQSRPSPSRRLLDHRHEPRRRHEAVRQGAIRRRESRGLGRFPDARPGLDREPGRSARALVAARLQGRVRGRSAPAREHPCSAPDGSTWPRTWAARSGSSIPRAASSWARPRHPRRPHRARPTSRARRSSPMARGSWRSSAGSRSSAGTWRPARSPRTFPSP